MSAAPPHIARYVVVDVLGRGGMGVVYRAWDPTLRRTVAIKVIGGAGEASDLVRFTREAQAVAALAHPNIITIYDVGSHDGAPFIAMECLEGPALADVIAARRPIPVTAKLEIALQLCDGLAFAHSRGIIHRDLKPANLKFTNTGVLKILDFGLARAVGDAHAPALTQAGAVIGTPHYMAPEQAEGIELDARSDGFALGAVLYELFTYRKAFSASSLPLLLAQILQSTPPPMRETDPSLPAALDHIVDRALQKDPDRRYQTVEALSRDLREVLINFGERGVAEDPTTLFLLPVPDAPTEVATTDRTWPGPVPVPRELGGPALGGSGSSATRPRPIGHRRPGRSAPARARPWPRRTLVALIVLALSAAGALAFVLARATTPEGGGAATDRSDSLLSGRAANEADTQVPDSLADVSPAPSTQEPVNEVPGDLALGSRGQVLRSVGARAPETGDPDQLDSPEAHMTMTPRCAQLVERLALGEPLGPADRAFVANRCRGDR